MIRSGCCALMLLISAVAIPIRAAEVFDPFDAAAIDRRPGAQVPLDLAFREVDGSRATLRQLAAGKPVLLAPVLHHCPNICGVTLSGLAQAVRAQRFKAGQDFAVVAFGIDPKEGPDAAAASLDALRAAYPNMLISGIHALTGKVKDIAAVTEALGYRYAWDPRIGQYGHIAAVAVLTRDGRLARWLYGLAPDPTDLKLALTEAGEGRLGSWGDQLLLLCYHYDPKTGRYGSLISWLLRLSGAATVAAAAGFIGFSLLRERGTGGQT